MTPTAFPCQLDEKGVELTNPTLAAMTATTTLGDEAVMKGAFNAAASPRRSVVRRLAEDYADLQSLYRRNDFIDGAGEGCQSGGRHVDDITGFQ